MTQDTVKATVEDIARTARTAGAEAYQAARSDIGSAIESAKDLARGEAELRAEAGRDFIADKAGDVASKLRAQALQDEFALRGRVTEMVAEGVSSLSRDLRRQSLASIIAETEAFARRNPAAFVAGAALAGFAMTRFGRATAPAVPAQPAAAVDDVAAVGAPSTVQSGA